MSQPFPSVSDHPTDTEVYYRGASSSVSLIGPLVRLVLWLMLAIFVAWAGRIATQALHSSVDNRLADWLANHPSAESVRSWSASRIVGWGFTIAGWIVVLQGLLFFLRRVWLWLSTSYTLTSDRLEIEQGILAKRITNVELWRVRDLDYVRNLFEFFFGIGRLLVTYQDNQDRRLFIGPIPNARQIYEKIKQARLKAGRKAGAQAVGIV